MPPLGSDPRCYSADGAGKTVPEPVIGGAGAWHVPTAAKERAPHLGEILRCSGSICRRLEVSLEDLSARYRSARRLPRPRADHVGVVSAAAPTTPLSSAAHTHGGAVRTARRRQTFGMG